MKIEIVDPSSLHLHPLLEQIPEADPELIISMQCDIEERGIDQPLLVDEKGRVVDGRLRLKIALALELPEIAIRRVAAADAATLIVQSLLQRRHYTKSALAYIAYPLFETALSEARARMVAHRFGSTQNALPGRTADEIARGTGVSRALFFQAAEVHKLFQKHPGAKTVIEPQILSGELCLGYAINGVAGWLATQQGKNTGQSGSDQLDLFHRGINALRVRFSRWNLLPQKCRLLVANEFAEAVAEAPPEVRERVAAALKNTRQASHR